VRVLPGKKTLSPRGILIAATCFCLKVVHDRYWRRSGAYDIVGNRGRGEGPAVMRRDPLPQQQKPALAWTKRRRGYAAAHYVAQHSIKRLQPDPARTICTDLQTVVTILIGHVE
jgi:hypothetical protein